MPQQIENPFTKVLEVNLFGPTTARSTHILTAIINFEIIIYKDNVIAVKNRVNNCEVAVHMFSKQYPLSIQYNTICGIANSIPVKFNEDSNKCECLYNLHCIFEYYYKFDPTYMSSTEASWYINRNELEYVRTQLNHMFANSPLSFELVQSIHSYNTSIDLSIKYKNCPVLGYTYSIRLEMINHNVIFTLYHQYINMNQVGHLGVNKLGIFIKGYEGYIDEQLCLYLIEIPLSKTPTPEHYEHWFMFVSHLIRYANAR